MVKRYVVHEFLDGCPMLIDREKKEMFNFVSNKYGQIQKINTPISYFIDNNMIANLIEQTKKAGYYNSTIDAYIFKYLMTPEEQAQCENAPYIKKADKIIVRSSDYKKAIIAMCEYTFEHKFNKKWGNRETYYSEMMTWCNEHFIHPKFSIKTLNEDVVLVSPIQKDTLPTGDEYTIRFCEVRYGHVTIISEKEPQRAEIVNEILAGSASYYKTTYNMLKSTKKKKSSK